MEYFPCCMSSTLRLSVTRTNNAFMTLKDSTVLITGGTGSFGSRVARHLLDKHPKQIRIFSRDEKKQWEMRRHFPDFRYMLGDVRDPARLAVAMDGVDFVFHAAAYKHVPIVEENPLQGIENNVISTAVVCNASYKSNVENFCLISTDKAVRPTNIMGASKRVAEMIVQSKNLKSQNTKFCMVRFGNVINSSGSAIPLFRKQIATGGPVTITHKKVTRFFMTIAEASSLVIQAGEFAKGGDVFILDMGEQVRIFDLAQKLIYLSGRNITKDKNGEGIQIKEIGLRPGEKLYEELLISGKELKTPNSKIFRSNEDFPSEDVLRNIINDLKAAIEDNNIVDIKNILKTHIEGFKQV